MDIHSSIYRCIDLVPLQLPPWALPEGLTYLIPVYSVLLGRLPPKPLPQVAAVLGGSGGGPTALPLPLMRLTV